MKSQKALLIGLVTALALLLAHEPAYGCYGYVPRYRIVDAAAVIVTGRIVRVADPACEEFQKPLSQWYHMHGTIDYYAWATGYLKVEKVIKGKIKPGDELAVSFLSKAPRSFSCSVDPATRNVGDEGLWLLKGSISGKLWATSPSSLLDISQLEKIAAIVKARKSKDTLDRYMLCSDMTTWVDLFEMVTGDGSFEKDVVLRWLAQLPAVVRRDRGKSFRNVFRGGECTHFIERVTKFRREEALFVSFVVFAASSSMTNKQRSKQTFAWIGAQILSSKFGNICFKDALAAMSQPGELDKKTAKRLWRYINRLAANVWRVREKAHRAIADMLKKRSDSAFINALLEAHEYGDPEQKHRIELILSPVRGKVRIMRLRAKLLPNLALLLSSRTRAAAAERLKRHTKIDKSIVNATIEKRTEFAQKVLDRLFVPIR